jgi:hypothetical protein
MPAPIPLGFGNSVARAGSGSFRISGDFGVSGKLEICSRLSSALFLRNGPDTSPQQEQMSRGLTCSDWIGRFHEVVRVVVVVMTAVVVAVMVVDEVTV